MKRLDENSRTERYWTATILSSLITDNQFAGVTPFLNLLKSPSGKILFRRRNSKGGEEIGGFREKKWNYENFQIATELRYARDFSKNEEYAVPDLTLLIKNKYLVVCEAKFFQRVMVHAIEDQISRQKQTIEDILATHKNIEYVHHAFIYGGSEEFSDIEGADSIITWDDIYEKFQRLKGRNNYFIRVLSEGIKNYKKEFPKRKGQVNYYTDAFDFIDLIIECGKHKQNLFVGLGIGGSSDRTLKGLIAGAKEELEILRKEHSKAPGRFHNRPEFLKNKGYKNQSSIEYLFKHSNQRYKVDYVENGSGDDKTDNPNWIDGASFLLMLKKLIK